MATLVMRWFGPQQLPTARAGALAAANDRELAVAAGNGQRDAFAELVRRHQQGVFNVAYRMTGNRRDAEDVTQETFLRALRAFDRFDPDRPLAPWLKRIAVNQCLNRWDSAREKLTTAAADLARPGDDRVEMDNWKAPRLTPEQAMVLQEESERVRAAISQLSPRYRTVIELRHFQGLSYAEIGAVMERSLSNVKSDLYRARRQLAELLEEKAT